MKLIKIFIVIFCFHTSIAHSAIYKCKLANGNLIFQDKPCQLDQHGTRLKIDSSGQVSEPKLKRGSENDNTPSLNNNLPTNRSLKHKSASKNSPLLNRKLWRAVMFSRFEEVKSLLENGADPNYVHWKPLGGESMLGVVGRYGEESKAIPVVKLLVGSGADINKPYGNSGPTPIMSAIGRNKWEIADFLLSKGANINARKKDGNTNLISVINTSVPKYLDIKKVKYLINNGADVHAKNGHFTALLVALMHGYDEVTELLLAENAKLILGNPRLQAEIKKIKQKASPSTLSLLSKAISP